MPDPLPIPRLLTQKAAGGSCGCVCWKRSVVNEDEDEDELSSVFVQIRWMRMFR